MRVVVTTPVLNGIDRIDATILSVIGQAGPFHLRYHVHDLGSTDGTARRLAWWQRRLADGDLPLQALTLQFSWASDPGTGLGAALCRGFGRLGGSDADFLTWLEPGDLLLPGALALAATLRQRFAAAELGWFGTAPPPVGLTGTPVDRALPTAALAAGLCDGRHWDRLDQPGVFFRKTLWQSIDPETSIAPLRAAVAWNLWRLLARKAAFVQMTAPLGQVAAPSAAAGRRDAEKAEAEALLPGAARRAALTEMTRGPTPTRRLLGTAPGAGAEPDAEPEGEAQTKAATLVVLEQPVGDALAKHAVRILGPAALAGTAAAAPPAGPRVIWRARETRDPAPLRATLIVDEGGIIGLEGHWQYPAITEQHAFHRMQRMGGMPAGTGYVGYPWATLIDKLQTGAADAALHLAAFRNFCRRLPRGDTLITVCQHIHLHRYLWLFRDAGIGHIFWSHATREDVAAAGAAGDGAPVLLHPFPLYPVQVPQQAPPPAGRRTLFSFIGARGNSHYLTQVRSFLLARLAEDPRGLVEGNDAWHYKAVVYDQQVHGRAPEEAEAKADQAAARRFAAVLADSVFALCPSGTGPNSIRLWEALGAGAIPVILADTWAPPGDPALWEAAALFCPETAEAVDGLPARLATLAADPARLSAMVLAGRQLWLLYGPDSFVTDIRLLLARLPATNPVVAEAAADPAPGALATLAGAETLTDADLLGQAASALLLGRVTPGALTAEDHPLAARIARARAALPLDHPAATLFARALSSAPAGPRPPPPPPPAAPPTPLAAPMTASGAVPVLCLFGPRANRTPLAYAPFRRDLGARLQFVTDPGRADLVMTGYVMDLTAIVQALAPLPRGRRPAIMVLSEEPLWDSMWSGDFQTRERSHVSGGETWPFRYLNHHTSTIFDFDRLPTFLLTRDDFAVRLAQWIDRHTALSAAEICAAWTAAPVPAAFVAERRDDPNLDCRYPEAGVLGLSGWRTRLAEAVTLPGTLRLGLGWPPDAAEIPDAPPPRRQDLPDWHLDKAARLDGRVALLGAVENTHQKAYVSEKPFDAFALRAMPICHAGPGHRLHDLIEPGAMLNTWGLTSDQAARQVMDFRPDQSGAEAWRRTARTLVQRLADTESLRAERERVLRAILTEVAALI